MGLRPIRRADLASNLRVHGPRGPPHRRLRAHDQPSPSCATPPPRPRRSRRAAARARGTPSPRRPPLGRLHELEHPDRPALRPAAQREPERGRRLALHLPGVHDQQRPVAPLPGRQAVGRHGDRLALRHRRPSVYAARGRARTTPATRSARQVVERDQRSRPRRPRARRPGRAVPAPTRSRRPPWRSRPRPAARRRGRRRGRGRAGAGRDGGPAVGEHDQQGAAARDRAAARPRSSRARPQQAGGQRGAAAGAAASASRAARPRTLRRSAAARPRPPSRGR